MTVCGIGIRRGEVDDDDEGFFFFLLFGVILDDGEGDFVGIVAVAASRGFVIIIFFFGVIVLLCEKERNEKGNLRKGMLIDDEHDRLSFLVLFFFLQVRCQTDEIFTSPFYYLLLFYSVVALVDRTY